MPTAIHSTVFNQPLRLAIVTETYPPEINGVANTMRHLVLGLQQRGHYIGLIRPRQRHEPIQYDHTVDSQLLVPGFPLPGYRRLQFGIPLIGQLKRFWQHWQPHAVYIATQGPLGRGALNTAIAHGTPVLTGFHTQFHQYSRYYGAGFLMQPIMTSLRRFHNRSNGTLVPTIALKEELTRSGFNNVGVFSRGVNTNLFTPERRSATLRQAWGCDNENCIAVLYVGRIAAEKNIELVFKTFHAISHAIPHSKLILVGDGPELTRCQRQYPDALFVGAKIGKELATHYASSDLFLFPSLTETFGNVVPEAMASGLAVVAFDDAAAHEHIQSGQNGITVAIAHDGAYIQAAVAAARDPIQLTILRSNARLTAETLSWERVVQGIEQQFHAIQQQSAIIE
ncbi:glycosyltransferase family 1 protein [Rhodoferax sp. 4810]|uniref:Glycosyltransferase family 1 protein n=1 Tax=Thiospirillum jenense TaxID=1653858 RepID=A0A839HEJ0_9GAMM|nr:glycosyltransferase family 1 protein [Thiospirillum jenense]MBB1075809.1 glycosyltransferase family 1 protein [Rhodoferax jenense]MBB1126884.1 glycosyltransferase family 1 protein [Thiospirillum jenense]